MKIRVTAVATAWVATLLSLALAAADAAAPAWPQTLSDIPADPAVRFGQLENGMRYAIMHNTTPAGQVALRLHMGSGSLQESDAQQGLAHFLEHMAFRGSKRVPDGEVQKTLERLGLKFGADTNAYTNETETVYQFDLAKNDAASIDTGLMMMRDTADGLTLDPKIFATERGVVISEQRLRDVPLLRMYNGVGEFQFEGQLAARRHPIGKLEVLQNAPIAELQDYYHKWYRPERATLIVVGDVDVDALEARVKSEFSSWAANGAAPAEPDLGKPMQRGLTARTFITADAAPMIDIGWVRPADTTINNLARERRDVLRDLALAALNRRLQAAAASSKPPFVQASVSVDVAGTYAEVTDLGLGYKPGEWREALQAAEKLRRQALEQGLSQAEVDREAAGLLSAVQAGASGAATRRSAQLAVGLVNVVSRNDIFTSPQRDLQVVSTVLKGVKAEDVNTELRALFVGSGPLAYVASPEPIAKADTEVVAALSEADGATLATASAVKEQSWPYTSFGTAGKVADRRHVDDLDLTTVRFANEVRLNIKPTKFSADQILVSVNIGNGRLDLSANKPNLIIAANSGAVIAGGLGQLNFTSLQSTLAGKIYRTGFNVGDNSYSLSGQTRPADFDLQLQVLAAYLTDAGFRDEGLEQVKAALAPQLQQISATPMALFSSGVGRSLHSGDLRWGMPTSAEVQAARSADLKAWLVPAFAKGPLEITVVGDVTVDQAIAAVAKTFGALPKRSGTYKQAAAGDTRMPAANQTPAVLSHSGAADQGIAAVAWPTTGVYTDIKLVPVRQLLAAILQDRVKQDLRERAGTSYTVQAQGQSSAVFPDFGLLMSFADIPPANAALFYESIAKHAAELRSAPVTSDELERARNPAVSNARQAQQTNQYYLATLNEAQRQPLSLDLLRQTPSGLLAVTAADIQKCAALYLRDDKLWKLLVKSGAGP
jgi:zinc protease